MIANQHAFLIFVFCFCIETTISRFRCASESGDPTLSGIASLGLEVVDCMVVRTQRFHTWWATTQACTYMHQ
jgi:hypothetical protein